MASDTVSNLTRPCTRCGAEKPATADHFYRAKRGMFGLGSVCKPCREDQRRKAGWLSDRGEIAASRRRKSRAANIEVERERGRDRYHQNREKEGAASLARYYANKPRVREYQRRKWKTRPDHRVRVSISAGIRKALKAGKSRRSWQRLVGYSVAELMRHLERQFLRGMTWENYGPVWHIDHIVPVKAFRAESVDSPEFRACWALSNLRPMWAIENVSKGGRRTHLL